VFDDGREKFTSTECVVTSDSCVPKFRYWSRNISRSDSESSRVQFVPGDG
jgi:hypothetical protein